MKIIFATNNEHKLREVRQILDGRYEVLSLDDIGCHTDIPETADTLDGNALQKARFVHERYGLDVFADDTGLEVEALGGMPGVHTARYAGDSRDTTANVNLLLHNMQDKDNRRACFRTAIALIKDGNEHLFEGRVDGEITRRREGEAGFGYDPIFRPEGFDGTFAQLGDKVKNQISHRARAVQRLVQFLTCLLLCLLPYAADAQEIGKWRTMPAYSNVQKTVAAGKTLWNTSNGNLWSYDTETEEIQTYGPGDKLSDINITQLKATTDNKYVVAVYEDSNIDIIETATGNVFNIANIANSDIAKTDVNDICLSGDELWLATAFGIVRINIPERIVIGTYLIDGGVNSVCISDMTPSSIGGEIPAVPTLFYASASGVFRAPLTANLHDKSVFAKLTSGVMQKLRWWKGNLICLGPNNALIQLSMKAAYTYPGNLKYILNIADWGDKLLLTTQSSLVQFTQDLKVMGLFAATGLTAACPVGDKIYAANGYNGLVRYQLANGKWTPTGGGVMPTGPRLENYYRLRANQDRVMTVSGGGDIKGVVWTASSFSVIKNGECTNLDTCLVTTAHPYHNMVDIIEDPKDPTHIYAAAYGAGLLEYRNQDMVMRYTSGNSKIGQAAGTSNVNHYSRLGALAYDNDGNLWMTNTNVDTALVYITPDGKWGNRYCEKFTAMQYLNNLVINNDYIWVTSGKHSNTPDVGIMCIKMNGTPTTFSDDKIRCRFNPIVQQDGKRYTVQNIYTIAIDHNNQLWVGTDMGLFIINSPEDFFTSDFTYQQIKINRNDGSGLADYLLNGLWCTAIAVDPANRKWIGTDGQGVYLVSADGQEEIYHFTTENSPLPTDKIQSIAICETTGEVAIGTERGLVFFNGDAQKAEEKLDADKIICYPNPVHPNYNGNITIKGLTMDAEVKITTITGQVIYRTHSNGGTATWNCRDTRGHRVATGVYNVIANNDDGSEAAVTRIVVTN